MLALRWLVAGLVCLAQVAVAQIMPAPNRGVVGGAGGGGSFSLFGGCRFDPRSEPTSPSIFINSGYNTRGSTTELVAHRYFRDDSTHLFFGYDLLLEAGPQPDTYQVSFFELGMGALDIVVGRGGRSNPADWKKMPIPAYPAPQVVHPGDKISIVLWVSPDTGQKLIDDVTFLPPGQNARGGLIGPGIIMGPGMVGRAGANDFTVPTVSGTARDFSAADAEMRINQARVKVNGETVEDAGNARIASGALVWFYLPHRGRYILSLAPHRELGFVKAGEVRGGAATFKDGMDDFVLECRATIATGSAPYILYMLHDPEWEPTTPAQVGRLQMGSVAAGEIAMLMKK